ncbi:hypothetical protein BH18THE1_BH18THE1_10590 [soil metagenome]
MPVYAQLFSSQRLKLNICAYAKHPVNQFTIKATCKGESRSKTLNYKGGGYKCSFLGNSGIWVNFLFSPKDRGSLDLYDVCIMNLSTQERHCETHYWFPGFDSSKNDIEIFTNR